MIKFVINSLKELDEAAKKILIEIKSNNIIAIYGDMGAGKTTLIKSLCRYLGVIETVKSPTFSLINEYSTVNNKIIYHFDFYRINSLNEIFDFGYEEYFYSGNICFIEWPEIINNFLPKNRLKIEIQVVKNEKRIIKLYN